MTNNEQTILAEIFGTNGLETMRYKYNLLIIHQKKMMPRITTYRRIIRHLLWVLLEVFLKMPFKEL